MRILTNPRPILLLMILCATSPLLAQDDGRQDNALGVLPPEAFQPRITPPVITVITSPDGYDNFDLGTDFAEPHATTNPLNPLQFFNAFNTNGTHHTQNGHDWTANNP